MKRLSKSQQKKFLNNLLKFTGPLLALFFGQLATGIPLKQAGLVALYALYAAISDYFSKVK